MDDPVKLRFSRLTARLPWKKRGQEKRSTTVPAQPQMPDPAVLCATCHQPLEEEESTQIEKVSGLLPGQKKPILWWPFDRMAFSTSQDGSCLWLSLNGCQLDDPETRTNYAPIPSFGEIVRLAARSRGGEQFPTPTPVIGMTESHIVQMIAILQQMVVLMRQSQSQSQEGPITDGRLPRLSPGFFSSLLSPRQPEWGTTRQEQEQEDGPENPFWD